VFFVVGNQRVIKTKSARRMLEIQEKAREAERSGTRKFSKWRKIVTITTLVLFPTSHLKQAGEPEGHSSPD